MLSNIYIFNQVALKLFWFKKCTGGNTNKPQDQSMLQFLDSQKVVLYRDGRKLEQPRNNPSLHQWNKNDGSIKLKVSQILSWK